jgi:hypothetical protein
LIPKAGAHAPGRRTLPPGNLHEELFFTKPAVTHHPVLYRFLYNAYVKTTLDIDDELLVKAKALSARERTSLTALIEEGLRLRLRRRRNVTPARTRPLAIYRGSGGLAPGVDPLTNRSLLDAADSDA